MSGNKIPSNPYILPQVIESVPIGKHLRITILDAACGLGRWGMLLRHYDLMYSETGTESTAYMIGCDIWLPYLQAIKKYSIYDDLIRCDVTNLPFKSGSIEIVLAIEILEHLSKGGGRRLLNEVQRVAKERVILTTPNFFFEQSHHGNPYEAHKSLWTATELRKLGYRVRGIGCKLWNPYSSIVKRRVLKEIIFFISRFLSIVAFVLPQISGILIAIKDFAKSR